ncbi:hypothetical protein WA026_015887 [Henosepilachna vigintioctopunctata]|uniref:Uncharacterized protein n=1 Tax=Henosepilachna vigintioctopunctata TaxID=420089 RepID=A0AAW1V2C0_9CUCU
MKALEENCPVQFRVFADHQKSMTGLCGYYPRQRHSFSTFLASILQISEMSAAIYAFVIMLCLATISLSKALPSQQPGAPNFPAPQQSSQNGGWQVNPSLSKGQDGNTQGSINVQHGGPNHQINAQVDKVIRGPNKSKPTFSVSGSWNF